MAPKLIAFKGPLDPDYPTYQPGEIALPPEDCAERLRELGVSCVVRLNDPDTYDRRAFARAGITHEVRAPTRLVPAAGTRRGMPRISAWVIGDGVEWNRDGRMTRRGFPTLTVSGDIRVVQVGRRSRPGQTCRFPCGLVWDQR